MKTGLPQAVVPLEERQLNEVDRLLEQVKTIQSECSHRYRLLGEFILPESQVEGVFIGGQETWSVAKFTVQCLDCSHQKEIACTSTCPRCLGEMKSTGDLEDRERYFGEDYLYYAAQLFRCLNQECGFSVVKDLWD